MTTIVKIIIGVLAFLLIVATTSAVYYWYKKPVAGSGTGYEKPPAIPVVTKIKIVEVPGPTKIVTIEKEVIVEKLKLPDWIKNNPDEQAIASAVVAPYKGKTNAVGILNTKTGVGNIVVKQEPLSLFGFVNEKEIGIRAGYSIKNNQEIDVYGKWDFARVGNVYIGAYVEANTTGDGKAMVSTSYKW